MATIVWALLGLTAICGTSLGYPVGVATHTTNQEIHVSDSSSSSSEEDIHALEEKLTVKAVVEEAALEEANEQTSHKDADPLVEENEERAAPAGGVETEGGEIVYPSSPRSATESTEEQGEGEEPDNTDVSES